MTTLESARPATAADDRGGSRRRIGSEAWTVIALFAITIVMILASRLISPSFGSWEQARAILILTSFVMVIAFGQQSVILLGGLDLSVGSMMTLGGILTFSWIGASGPALVWGIPAVLLVTGLVGAVNGIGVTVFRVPPFIMTLAMGIIIYSAALGITGGTPSGQSVPLLSALFTHSVAGIPWVIILMAVLAVLGTLLQQATPFGRRLYAIGTSPQAALIAGIPVRRIVILTYGMSGAAAGLAGVLMVGYGGGATLTMGDSYLLPSIAAVVIGGTSIVGGRGLYAGAIGGAFLLTTLSTVIASIGIAQGWRTIIYGLVILFALVLLREELSIWIVRQKTRGRP
jgi:ribose transport system permease protein